MAQGSRRVILVSLLVIFSVFFQLYHQKHLNVTDFSQFAVLPQQFAQAVMEGAETVMHSPPDGSDTEIQQDFDGYKVSNERNSGEPRPGAPETRPGSNSHLEQSEAVSLSQSRDASPTEDTPNNMTEETNGKKTKETTAESVDGPGETIKTGLGEASQPSPNDWWRIGVYPINATRLPKPSSSMPSENITKPNIVLLYADDWTMKVLGALNPEVTLTPWPKTACSLPKIASQRAFAGSVEPPWRRVSPVRYTSTSSCHRTICSTTVSEYHGIKPCIPS